VRHKTVKLTLKVYDRTHDVRLTDLVEGIAAQILPPVPASSGVCTPRARVRRRGRSCAWTQAWVHRIITSSLSMRGQFRRRCTLAGVQYQDGRSVRLRAY
jgi:hypothetical protein